MQSPPHPAAPSRSSSPANGAATPPASTTAPLSLSAGEARAYLHTAALEAAANGIAITDRDPVPPATDQEIRERDSTPSERQLRALLALNASPLLAQDDLMGMFRLITETAAAALEVERVSIWHRRADGGVMHCLDLFERSPGRHTAGAELNVTDFPGYFTALLEGDVIAAHRAGDDPRTRELHRHYLQPFGISSILDATVRIAGDVYGVVCHEHIGPPRNWSSAAAGFAAGVANLVARAVADQERRWAEAALRASEQCYRSFFKGIPLPAYVVDLHTMRFIDVSDSMVAHYGYSRAEFLGMTTLDIRSVQDEARLQAAMAALTDIRTAMGLWTHRKKNGDLIEVEVSAQLIDFEGRRAGLVLLVDMTGRLRMERALRDSDERFREMAENIDEVFWMKDPATHVILYLSPAFARIWGRPAEEFCGVPDALLPTIYSLDQQRMAEIMAQPVTAEVKVDYRIQRPDGTVRWIRDRAFPVRDAAGRVFRVVGVAEDVTEHAQLEQNFLRAQRMESLGRLAGGIAHDLNNILAPILIAIPLLREPRNPASHFRIMDTIESSAWRGAALVKQLLLFGRGSAGEHTALRLKDSVFEAQNILRETLPKNCDFTVKLPRDLWLVRAEATQIHQVLLNLCVNACDAMPQGGTLAISAENRVLAEWETRPIAGARPGSYVLLRVSDSGTGIPPELLEKIFDPFFTTKPIGKGTGLGLATVASIAKSHGGFVTVQSEPGHGTTFCLGLPALVDAAALSVAQAPGVEALLPRGHGENILVVDDEEAIRSMLQEILTHQGYTVHTATGGAEGAAMVVDRAGHFQLVLSDLNMPRMDGLAMFQLIRQTHPTIPLIVLSGTISGEEWPARAAELKRLGVRTILPKPFSARSVLVALHEALASQQLEPCDGTRHA